MTEDEALKQALVRLQRTNDLVRVTDYISGRRDLHISSLINHNPNDVGLVAGSQGAIRAFNEIIGILKKDDNA